MLSETSFLRRQLAVWQEISERLLTPLCRDTTRLSGRDGEVRSFKSCSVL